MSIANQSKPTTSLTNATKINIGETWDSITTVWGGTQAVSSLLDSYSETNSSSTLSSYAGGATLYLGQSFEVTDTATLGSCKFYINKSGSPTGSVYATLYAHTGTFGSSGKATGSVLATSDAVDVSGLDSGALNLVTFTFSGVQKYEMSAGNYVIVISYNGGDSSNFLAVGRDATTPTHAGNLCYSADASSWTANLNNDLVFYIYEELQVPIANGETRTWEECQSLISNNTKVSSSMTNIAKPI